jgi:hypothetical protein
MTSFGQEAVEETIDPYGVEGFDHIQENRTD